MGEGNYEFGLTKYLCSYFSSDFFLHAIKSYNVGPPALFPLLRNACCGFLSSLKIHRLSQV
jgi:hypothetical protein